jgi:hypothetical protein
LVWLGVGLLVICGEKTQAVGFDPFDGLEEQSGDHRLNADTGAVLGCLDDDARVFLIARILPFRHDLHAVTDFERFGAVAWYRLFHDRRYALSLR